MTSVPIRAALATAATLALLGPVAGQERVIVSEPVILPQPPPGYQRHEHHAAGPWRVWLDARARNPRHRVVTYEMQVHRTRDAGEPELLLETGGRSGDIKLWLAPSGQVLVGTPRSIMLCPVGGDPVELSLQGSDDRSLRLVSFSDDCVIALRRQSPRDGNVQVVRFDLDGDGPPIVLDDAPYPLAPYNFVSNGSWAAWLRPGDRQRYPPTVHAAARHEPAREIPLAGLENPTLDGVHGDWLILHDEDLVRLLDLETGRELQLRMPSYVEMAHPRGILWRADASFPYEQPSRLDWWDLATGERRHLLVRSHGM